MNHKEDEPQEDESVEKPVEITIGSKVKWTKDGKMYRVKKELVTLN